jgi:hypothetical protein
MAQSARIEIEIEIGIAIEIERHRLGHDDECTVDEGTAPREVRM